MKFNGKLPKLFRASDGSNQQTESNNAKKTTLYYEVLEHLILKIDPSINLSDGIKGKVDKYLSEYDNDFDEARKHLFSDFDEYIKKIKP
jgi:hypothetical protein